MNLRSHTHRRRPFITSTPGPSRGAGDAADVPNDALGTLGVPNASFGTFRNRRDATFALPLNKSLKVAFTDLQETGTGPPVSAASDGVDRESEDAVALLVRAEG